MSKLSTEKELINRFQQGDALAFNTIYNRYYSSLRYFAHRLICRKQEAERIAIETFIKLYRLCGNFENMAGIRAFLYVTARNACYDYLSYSHRKPALDNEDMISWTEQEQEPATGNAAGNTLLKAIVEAVENLPEECGKVFKMAYVQGLKTMDIARLLALPEQAVRTCRRRSIKLLRVILFEKRLPEAALVCLNVAKTGALASAREVTAM